MNMRSIFRTIRVIHAQHIVGSVNSEWTMGAKAKGNLNAPLWKLQFFLFGARSFGKHHDRNPVNICFFCFENSSGTLSGSNCPQIHAAISEVFPTKECDKRCFAPILCSDSKSINEKNIKCSLMLATKTYDCFGFKFRPKWFYSTKANQNTISTTT
jgi:hypothetical protein